MVVVAVVVGRVVVDACAAAAGAGLGGVFPRIRRAGAGRLLAAVLGGALGGAGGGGSGRNEGRVGVVVVVVVVALVGAVKLLIACRPFYGVP